MDAQNNPVTVPYVDANRAFDYFCMTTMPDKQNFALLGGYQYWINQVG
jgi:hypothetical protein